MYFYQAFTPSYNQLLAPGVAISHHHDPCLLECPALQSSTLQLVSDLIQKKEDAVRILIDAASSVAKMEAQMGVKRRRLRSITKLSSSYNVSWDYFIWGN
jgi:hypothetical protein